MGGTWQPPRHASKNMAASAQHVMLYKRADLMLAGSQIHMYISFQCLRRDAGAMSSQWQTSLSCDNFWSKIAQRLAKRNMWSFQLAVPVDKLGLQKEGAARVQKNCNDWPHSNRDRHTSVSGIHRRAQAHFNVQYLRMRKGDVPEAQWCQILC
eukprot:1158443-Pelagomonas_calceolata.AAC.13